MIEDSLSFYICIGLEFKGWVAVEGNLFKCFFDWNGLTKQKAFLPWKTPSGAMSEKKQKGSLFSSVLLCRQ